MIRADVAVIGGGCAGLAAAVRLATAGKRVVVVEASGRLGGRASTFVDRETRERVDNGQHVLFGCYRETYALLDRLGTAARAPLDRALEVTMAAGDGHEARLACPAMPWPWHLCAGVLRWRAISLADRLGILRLAAMLRVAGGTDPPREATVTRWLESQGQSIAARRWLWNPLAYAALNQSPDVAAAAPFVRVLRELIGTRREDSAIGVPGVTLEDLIAAPAARAIAQCGGAILTGHPARVTLDAEGGVTGVATRETAIAATHVIGAVPWHALSRLWDGRCPEPMRQICDNADRMAASPIVTVNLWFDRVVLPCRFVGLPDGRLHWAFDKGAILGDGAAHVAMVASGADALALEDTADVAGAAVADLGRAVPNARSAALVRSLVIRERRATFSLAIGEPPRPATITPLPRFYLAGDWIDTGLPATIESAVRSGHAAAEAVLGA